MIEMVTGVAAFGSGTITIVRYCVSDLEIAMIIVIGKGATITTTIMTTVTIIADPFVINGERPPEMGAVFLATRRLGNAR